MTSVLFIAIRWRAATCFALFGGLDLPACRQQSQFAPKVQGAIPKFPRPGREISKAVGEASDGVDWRMGIVQHSTNDGAIAFLLVGPGFAGLACFGSEPVHCGFGAARFLAGGMEFGWPGQS